ncbi:MAG: N-acetyl-gamma-glutamyl-phosphate reductase [Rhodobacteraceae bacterium]|nr:N-acetyl-gamma-glutamyl-phosphate reductase [Paracoccaceae bacterium]
MKKVAIIGASGYTGAELLRIICLHPGLKISALAADRNAGKHPHEVFPGLRNLELPVLEKFDRLDFSDLDLVFCALPHGASHTVIRQLPAKLRIVDLSADFRLRDKTQYLHWYGQEHAAPELLQHAVYGLSEFYRGEIAAARLVACTGCNAATGLYALLPLMTAGVIDYGDIVIDLKTGVSGAGRAAKVATLHSEVSEGVQAYNVAAHRHLAEFDQELSRAAGKPVRVTFAPHLLPLNRGILATIYVRGEAGEIHSVLAERYADEPFLSVLPLGQHPSTRHVRGSNYVHIGCVADRRKGRTIIFTALDNLTKGSSGQAVQNANLMLGLPETAALQSVPLFP